MDLVCSFAKDRYPNDMTIPFRPVARAASGSTSGEKAEMACRPRRGCRGGVVL